MIVRRCHPSTLRLMTLWPSSPTQPTTRTVRAMSRTTLGSIRLQWLGKLTASFLSEGSVVWVGLWCGVSGANGYEQKVPTLATLKFYNAIWIMSETPVQRKSNQTASWEGCLWYRLSGRIEFPSAVCLWYGSATSLDLDDFGSDTEVEPPVTKARRLEWGVVKEVDDASTAASHSDQLVSELIQTWPLWCSWESTEGGITL